jgi:membrane protein
MFGRLRSSVASMRSRDAATAILAEFREHGLLVEASAIAFRVLLATIPAALFLIGLLGFLNLDSVWRDEVVPSLRDSVSQSAFRLIDDTVTYVLERQQVFWITIGLALAVWEMSAVVRAVARVLNRIYGVADDRSERERLLNSLWVAALVGVLILGALAAVMLGAIALADLLGRGPLASVVSFVVRWAVALVLLLAAVALPVRVGPDVKREVPWVTFGAVLVVLAWAVSSALFALYLTNIADYGSVFGNLATAFILLEYLYIVSIAFLAGLVLDAIAEGRGR